jgi:DnaJ homolog subfamily B member 4
MVSALWSGAWSRCEPGALLRDLAVPLAGGMPGGFTFMSSSGGGLPGGMMGGFPGMMGGMGGGGAGAKRRGPQKAEPIKRQLLLTLEDLYNGVLKKIKITRQRMSGTGGGPQTEE